MFKSNSQNQYVAVLYSCGYKIRFPGGDYTSAVDVLLDTFCKALALLPPFSILRRRTAILLMKNPAEIKRVIIPNDPGDFIHGIIRGFQQHLGVCDADRCDKLHGSSPGVSFEISDKPADTHSF